MDSVGCGVSIVGRCGERERGVIMRKTEPPLMTIADTMAYLQCSRRLSCWVPNSGTLLGTGNVGIGVHFRTFSVCAVCLEIVGIPPFWHEKKGFRISPKTLKAESEGFEPSSR